ncbi:MAG: hypothetical protein ACE5Q6_12680, partial [Dehalococcoidia bacterium]
ASIRLWTAVWTKLVIKVPHRFDSLVNVGHHFKDRTGQIAVIPIVNTTATREIDEASRSVPSPGGMGYTP